jgi:hypothetical protein
MDLSDELSLEMLGKKPARISTEEQFAPWFESMAEQLLNATDFLVQGVPHRFAELEFYYHGPGHEDPFAHRNPVQLENGRWYFHKSHGQYRGGSFKGLDLGFGDGTAHFGVLIRTIIGPDGTLIDGPSLSVDYLLQATEARSAARLDAWIGTRKLWDATAPISVRPSQEFRTVTIHTTSRIGLSLKKAAAAPTAPRFVGKAYRFLTEPKAISKGKLHLVLSLHRRGKSMEEIRQTTGTPRKSIERYVERYELGKREKSLAGYVGRELDRMELAQMLGAWAACNG